MLRVFSGAALVIAGIAAFIEVHSHPYVRAVPAPSEYERALEAREELHGAGTATPPNGIPAHGLSPTAHDLLLIAAWALVVVGALLVITGLIRYSAMQRSAR
jgi:cytochrome b subunit of formate dehydrogenase